MTTKTKNVQSNKPDVLRVMHTLTTPEARHASPHHARPARVLTPLTPHSLVHAHLRAPRLGWIEAAPDIIKTLSLSGYIVSGGGVAPMQEAIMSHLLPPPPPPPPVPSLPAQDDSESESRCDSGMMSVDGHLEYLRGVYARRCGMLCDALEEMGFTLAVRPSGGYFVWCELPANVEVKRFQEAAKRHDLRIMNGLWCAADADALGAETAGVLGRRLRLCFAWLDEEAMLAGLEDLKAALAECRE